MKLHYSTESIKKGLGNIVNSLNSPLKRIQFERIFLDKAKKKFFNQNRNQESVLDILGGRCSIKIENPSFGQVEYKHIGERKDVFSGRASMIYIPSSSKYTIIPETENLDIAVVETPSNLICYPALIKPEKVINMNVGKNNWQRFVQIAVGADVKAKGLMVGETFNPSGNWSGYPPHKHDTKMGQEEIFEELYFFLVDPPQGFAFIRIYSKASESKVAFDKVYVIKNGDVVVIPYGYHTITVAPGYKLFYLWALSGEVREFGRWSDDKDHVWVGNKKL